MSSSPVVAAALPTAYQGNTYYISPNGSMQGDGTEAHPWSSVKDALDLVGGGNTFILMPGTYSPIIIYNGHGGTSDHRTIIRSQFKWQAVIDGSIGNLLEGVANDFVGNDYITYDGLKVINAKTFGIDMGGNYNTTINCWVSHSKMSGITGWNHSNLVVQGNLIEYNGTDTLHDHGIYISGFGLTVTGNIVRHNASCGIGIGSPFQNAVVSGNLSYGQPANISFNTCGQGGWTPSMSITDNITLDSSVGGILSWGVRFLSAWSGNRVESSVKGTLLDAIVSNDMQDYAQTLSQILPPVQPNSGSVPTATVFYSGFWGDGLWMVMVRYTSTGLLDLSRIGEDNVLIKGPAGYSYKAKELKYMLLKDKGTLEVMYYLPDPLTGWMPGYSGQYSVFIQSGQVSDMAGNFCPGGTNAGSFTITIGNNPPPMTTGSMFPEDNWTPYQTPDPPPPVEPVRKSSSIATPTAAISPPRMGAPMLSLLSEVPSLFTWDLWKSTVGQSDLADNANWSRSFLRFFSRSAFSSASFRLEWMACSTNDRS